MDAQCQCGAVTFKTPSLKPLALYICHCAECRRQTSSAFGASAIFPRFPLPNADLLSCYARPLANGDTLYCYFCKRCGTRLIHSTPNKSVVSVKGGCIDGLDWKAAIHIWTKSAMVPIPEGSGIEEDNNLDMVETSPDDNPAALTPSPGHNLCDEGAGPMMVLSTSAGSVSSSRTTSSSSTGSDLAAYYRRTQDLLD
ncbi:Mss4-like protein [Apodospora peruviana]|uniref:Mss4-like protein n=1 Tax=Apodospora peruviana TaxID=516989 RepID=A0AAE0MEM1_9PEZI|nr:Mss4-like protein [Apodospora peruviana]